jgi:hypothetical protein
VVDLLANARPLGGGVSGATCPCMSTTVWMH